MRLYKKTLMLGVGLLLAGCKYDAEVSLGTTKIEIPDGFIIASGKSTIIRKGNTDKGISYLEKTVYGHFIMKGKCEDAPAALVKDSVFIPEQEIDFGEDEKEKVMDYCIESGKGGKDRLFIKKWTMDNFKYDDVIENSLATVERVKAELGDNLDLTKAKVRKQSEIDNSWVGKNYKSWKS